MHWPESCHLAATIIADIIITFPVKYCEIRWKLMEFERSILMLFKIKDVDSCDCVYHTMMVKHYRDFAWIKVYTEIVIWNLESWSQTQMRFRHIDLQLKTSCWALPVDKAYKGILSPHPAPWHSTASSHQPYKESIVPELKDSVELSCCQSLSKTCYMGKFSSRYKMFSLTQG